MRFHGDAHFFKNACVALALIAATAISDNALANDAPLIVKTTGQTDNLIKFDPNEPNAPGLSVEVMRAVERLDPGLKFSGQETLRTVGRIDKDLEGGAIDVFFGLVSNATRREKHSVILTRLYEQSTQLAVKIDDNIDIKTLDDIRKLGSAGVIGVPKGSAYVEYLNQQGGLLVDDGAVSASSTLQKILLGRIRFVFFGGTVLTKQIREDGLEDKLKLLPARFNVEDVCVMLSKKADPALGLRIQRALEKLRASGELTAIQTKYSVRSQ